MTTKIKIVNEKRNYRRCLITNQLLPKHELIRIVKQKDHTILVNSNASGKGAYVCKSTLKDLTVFKQKRLLNRAFKSKVDSKIYDEIIDLLTNLAVEN